MKRTKIAVSFFFLLSLPFARSTQADWWDKKTDVTFSQPVEVPGTVLPAGTYVFKLADSDSNRNIVQIFNKDENHVYATILAITEQRLQPADKTVITFEEHSKNAPEAVKAWFYPGENTGFRFVYPKQKAMEIARNNNENVPAMTSPSASQETEATPVALVDAQSQVAAPKQELAAISQGDLVSVDEPMIAQADTSATMPDRLPKTASDLPLLLASGSVSLLGILPIRLLRRRSL